MVMPMGDEDNEYKKMLMAQLMNQQAEPVPESNDNQMLAGLAQSMNKMGTIRGKSADSSDIGRYADTLDKAKQSQAMMAQNRLGKQQSLLAELAKLKDNQAMKQNDLMAKNTAITEQRTFDAGQAKTKFDRDKELLGMKQKNDQLLAEQKTNNVQKIKPPTESQATSGYHAKRMTTANDTIEQIMKSGYNPAEYSATMRKVNLPFVGQIGASSQDRSFEQAAREFIASVLRKETGASVTPQEFKDYSAIYFPAPGEDPQTIAQKADARKRATEAMVAMAGSAYDPSQQSKFTYTPPVEEGTALAASPPEAPTNQKALEDMTDEELEAYEAKLEAGKK